MYNQLDLTNNDSYFEAIFDYLFDVSGPLIYILLILALGGMIIIPFSLLALIWNILTKSRLNEMHWVKALAKLQLGEQHKNWVLMTDKMYFNYDKKGMIKSYTTNSSEI